MVPQGFRRFSEVRPRESARDFPLKINEACNVRRSHKADDFIPILTGEFVEEDFWSAGAVLPATKYRSLSSFLSGTICWSKMKMKIKRGFEHISRRRLASAGCPYWPMRSQVPIGSPAEASELRISIAADLRRRLWLRLDACRSSFG